MSSAPHKIGLLAVAHGTATDADSLQYAGRQGSRGTPSDETSADHASA